MTSEAVAIREDQSIQHEMSVRDVQLQVQKIQEVMKSLMKEGEHYGVIPGTDKPTLYKAGSEKLCLMFRYDPEYDVEESTVSDKLIYYRVKCTLYHIPTGLKVASGLGSCNSRENKYRWRKGELACPDCGTIGTLNKSKYEPEWYCWAKKGGCGAKFPLDAIEAPGKVENDNPYNEDNTLLKMACKRALVAAVLNGTAASDIFTQDLEDLVANGVIQTEEKQKESKQEKKQPEQDRGPVDAAKRPTKKQLDAVRKLSKDERLSDALRKKMDEFAANPESAEVASALIKSANSQLKDAQEKQEAPF